MHLIGYEGDSIYVVVDAEKKKLQSGNVIFLEGNAHCQNNEELLVLKFPNQKPAQIKEVTETESDAEEKRRRCMKSKVWGMDPIRRSEQLTGHSEKVLIMKIK